MKTFVPIMLAIIVLGCQDTAEPSGGALATPTANAAPSPAIDASPGPATVLDAGRQHTECQTLCDYSGCRVVCAGPTSPVDPDEDPYD